MRKTGAMQKSLAKKQKQVNYCGYAPTDEAQMRRVSVSRDRNIPGTDEPAKLPAQP
jgi:hypothetical protein